MTTTTRTRPRLTEAEEAALGVRALAGDKRAIDTLVTRNMGLAHSMANTYRRTWTDVRDLVQEAAIGMTVAAQRWDPSQGVRFGTYAAYWMRAQLGHFLMTQGRAVHTGNTRDGRKLYQTLPRVRDMLRRQGREESVENVAAEMAIDETEVRLVMERLDGADASLDSPVSTGDDDGGATLADCVASDDVSPETDAANGERQAMIFDVTAEFVGTLTCERDRAIWLDHLAAETPASLVDLGARFGVSKQRMGQLADRIKRSARRHVVDSVDDVRELFAD